MTDEEDRARDLQRAAAMSLGSDTDELGAISPHPHGDHGDYKEDYPKPDPEEVEAILRSYDRTDVSDDN
ncbi:hypothetical protein AB3R30_21705 [Leptolyngbyaceae cyanobacterium UHCC 1019]